MKQYYQQDYQGAPQNQQIKNYKGKNKKYTNFQATFGDGKQTDLLSIDRDVSGQKMEIQNEYICDQNITFFKCSNSYVDILQEINSQDLKEKHFLCSLKGKTIEDQRNIIMDISSFDIYCYLHAKTKYLFVICTPGNQIFDQISSTADLNLYMFKDYITNTVQGQNHCYIGVVDKNDDQYIKQNIEEDDQDTRPKYDFSKSRHLDYIQIDDDEDNINQNFEYEDIFDKQLMKQIDEKFGPKFFQDNKNYNERSSSVGSSRQNEKWDTYSNSQDLSKEYKEDNFFKSQLSKKQSKDEKERKKIAEEMLDQFNELFKNEKFNAYDIQSNNNNQFLNGDNRELLIELLPGKSLKDKVLYGYKQFFKQKNIFNQYTLKLRGLKYDKIINHMKEIRELNDSQLLETKKKLKILRKNILYQKQFEQSMDYQQSQIEQRLVKYMYNFTQKTNQQRIYEEQLSKEDQQLAESVIQERFKDIKKLSEEKFENIYQQTLIQQEWEQKKQKLNEQLINLNKIIKRQQDLKNFFEQKNKENRQKGINQTCLYNKEGCKNIADVIFFPCQHLVICQNCYDKENPQCCDKFITKVLKMEQNMDPFKATDQILNELENQEVCNTQVQKIQKIQIDDEYQI